jgi:signal transduction histidine kinase
MKGSLRIRLPLVISGLIAVSLLAFLTVSFEQVQRELLRAGAARAQAAAEQLASLLAQSAQQQMTEVRRVAGDAAIARYLQQQSPAAEDGARQQLQGLASAGQPPVELWDGAGTRLLAVAPTKAMPAAPAVPASRPPGAEGVGAFQASGQDILWDVIGEARGGTAGAPHASRGFVVSRRFLTNRSNSDALGRLVGAGALIRLGNTSGGVWSDLSRIVAPPAVQIRPGSIADDRLPGGERIAGFASQVRGTPWLVAVEFPRSGIVAPARSYLLRMLVVVAVLVLAAAAAAYAASARITTPLGQLTRAAESIARGRFEQLPETRRRDEIGRLSVAFQEMATEVQSSRRELETRVEERTRAIGALNAQLEGRVTELKSLTGELEAFSYSVSHDLRAPVRHVAGFAALLEKSVGASIDDQSRRYIRTISSSAARMGRLIDDLLAFSRMGRAEMLRARVDLSGLVDEVRREVEPERGASEIVWTVHPLPVVEGDPAMLRIVLTNLLSNAVKYSAMRSPAKIEIGSAEGSRETVLFVRDNGVGFDMNHAANLFGVFQRLHSADQFEGVGIGLANVRRIVNRHGGRTWAESTPEQGATFFVAVPADRIASPAGDLSVVART